MKFVLFHGSFGSPEKNWFQYLKNRLTDKGQEVIVPWFPVEDWKEVTHLGPGVPPKNQTLLNWLKEFTPIGRSFKKEREIMFRWSFVRASVYSSCSRTVSDLTG